MAMINSRDINGWIDILLALNAPPNGNGSYREVLTKSEKLAFTCQIAVIMFALVRHEQESNPDLPKDWRIHTDLLPVIALSYAIQEYQNRDILPDTYRELFEYHDDLAYNFRDATLKEVCKLISPSFQGFICSFNGTFEAKVFKASMALANYYESGLTGDQAETASALEKYKEFPIIREMFENVSPETDTELYKLHDLFSEFLSLRNIRRWRPDYPPRNFSVLAHSFNVAVYNYLISSSEIGFAIGLYHDIPEIWTGDIPDPRKHVVPGLNERISELEKEKIRQNVFSRLPSWYVPTFEMLMLEFLPEVSRPFYKLGDTLDAYVEASIQYSANPNKKRLEKFLLSGIIKAEKQPEIVGIALKKLCKEANIPVAKVWYTKIKHKISSLKTT